MKQQKSHHDMIPLLLTLISTTIAAQTPSKSLINCADYNLPSTSCRKLENIVKDTPHGNGLSHRLDELPEQIMTAHYLKKDDNVLEIGSNTGRNTLTIAKILDKSSIFYTSESNMKDRSTTKENLEANKLAHENVHVIPSISNSPLEQKGWVTRPRTLFGWLNKWKPVESTQLPPVKFDTIIADCEGCLLKMTDEHPDLLKNATTIILENDWTKTEDDNKMHQIFYSHGFKTVYNHHGPTEIIYKKHQSGHPKAMPDKQFQHFYEVLVKDQLQ